MKFEAFFCSALLVCSHAVADDLGSQPTERSTESSANPTEGINKFLKGLTTSINEAVAQAQKPQGSKAPQPNSQAASQSERAAVNQPSPQPAKDNAVLLSATSLNGIFAKHPYDGTAKSQYPKVAVIVTDWSRSDCWKARAKVWWNEKKSESVPSFAVCWRDSLARAADSAVNYQLFMRQMSVGHSGNVRTEGPKAPMMAYPMPDPFGVANYAKGQQAISFIQQLLMETGWQAGSQTNIWVVGYDNGGR